MTDPAVPSEVGAPYDWCPECDGPGDCQPGTCCGRPYPSLEEAEVIARDAVALNPWLVSLLAEYDKRGQVMAAEITDNDRLRAELALARRVAAKWEDMGRCYRSTDEQAELAELLDELCDGMKEASDV